VEAKRMHLINSLSEEAIKMRLISSQLEEEGKRYRCQSIQNKVKPLNPQLKKQLKKQQKLQLKLRYKMHQ